MAVDSFVVCGYPVNIDRISVNSPRMDRHPPRIDRRSGPSARWAARDGVNTVLIDYRPVDLLVDAGSGERRVAMIGTKTIGTGSPRAVVRYPCNNHLGRASLERDPPGQLITYEEYHPYGTTAWWAEKSGIQVSRKRYRYTGMERDEETGMAYHHHRYYLPWLGRWASADPAGLVDGVNRYQYGRGRVVGESDRSGLQSAPPDETLVQAGMRAKAGQFLGTGAAFAASAGDLVDFVQDPPVYTSAEHRVLAFGLSSVDASGMLQSVSNDMLALGTKVSPEGTEAGVAIGVFGPGVLSGLDLAGPAVKLVRELDELGEVVLDAAKQGLEEGAALVEAGLKHDLSAGKFLASKGPAIIKTGDVDAAADALASRIGGQSSVRIEGFGNREFDAISDTLVAQAFGPSAAGETPTFVGKPANFLSKSRRTQIRETLRAAGETGREALFEFEGGVPHDDVLSFIQRNADQQGVGVNIQYR